MESAVTFRNVVGLEDLVLVRRFTEQAAGYFGAGTDTAADLVMAINEAVTNIIVHGYANAAGEVEIMIRQEGDQLVATIRDRGQLFDPTTLPAPDITVPLEARGWGGMGIHMMRHFTDDLHYQVTEDGQNELIMLKKEG